MKRQRKHRAFDVNNQKMIYDGFSIIGNASGTFHGARLHGVNDKNLQNLIQKYYTEKSKSPLPDWGDYDLVDWTDFSKLIVMDCINPTKDRQYHIYEGDIVRIYSYKDDDEKNNESTDHVIVYSEEETYPCYELFPHISDELNDISALEHDEWIEDYEIIGNIYEHDTLVPSDYIKKYPEFINWKKTI